MSGDDFAQSWQLAQDVATALVPVFCGAIFFVVWSQLRSPAAAWRKAGYERPALYLEMVISGWGLVGFLVVIEAVHQALHGGTMDEYLSDVWLNGDISTTHAVVLGALLYFAHLAIGYASGWLATLFGEEETPLARLMRPRTAGERLVWLTAVSPTAGFGEEFVFRGVLLSGLLSLTDDPVIAVGLSSLLFGLGHAPYGLTWTIMSSVLGAVTAIFVLWTQSLWPAILAHTFYDMTVYYIFYGDIVDEGERQVPAKRMMTLPTPPLR